MTTIYKKLLEIQQAVDHFAKDKKGFNYKYTTGDQILNKIRPLMNDKGLLLKQEITSIVNTRIDYKTNKGDKSEMLTTAMMSFTWIDTETGEKDVNSFGSNGMNDWDKGLGSCLTYAERYFLLKYFHVPTDEDNNDEVDMNRKKSFNNDPISKPKNSTQEKEYQDKRIAVKKIFDLADIKEVDKKLVYEEAKKRFKNSYLDKLEKKQLTELYKWIQSN